MWSRLSVSGAVAACLLLVMFPALRLDARILGDPAEARYPGVDDSQYVTGISGGAIWPAAAGPAARSWATGPPTRASPATSRWHRPGRPPVGRSPLGG